MNSIKAHKAWWREMILIILLLATFFVWLRIWQQRPSTLLKVAFLDVGQGDAIFIETPSKRQILIDGGKNRQVVSRLGSLMPFGDRSIDVVIATHPDGDHIGGLPEVFARYEVALMVEGGAESDNLLDDELRVRVENEKSGKLMARRGQVIDFGDGVRLEILFPNQDVSRWETNDASIVARLVYGESSFLFTGDSPLRVENILLSLDQRTLDVDVLKAGHHGSRTSTSAAYVSATSPQYAVISAGKDNSYGHPHKEVLDILRQASATTLSTIEKGIIRFETDGRELKLK